MTTLGQTPDRTHQDAVLQARRNADASLTVIWEALHQKLEIAGFDAADIKLPSLENAKTSLRTDPLDNSQILVLVWSNAEGHKFGEFQLRESGSFFVEMDVAQKHPNDHRWFVESVIAWRQDNSIETDLRLIPAL